MYQRVIAAVDLTGSADVVLETAHSLCGQGATLRVLHVTEAPVTGYGVSTAQHHIANEMQAREACFPALKTLVEAHALPHSAIDIRLGRPVDEIHRAAEMLDADLIVVGSHGHGGVRALLGATANGVFHGASCDVLAVRIDDDTEG